jgi:hypothetical protein
MNLLFAQSLKQKILSAIMFMREQHVNKKL